MDAELQASSDATQRALWLRILLANLDLDTSTISIKNDNNGAIALTKHPNNFDKSKDFDIRQNFVREKVEDNLVSLDKVSSQDNTANILTKPLEYLRNKLGLAKQPSKI